MICRRQQAFTLKCFSPSFRDTPCGGMLGQFWKQTVMWNDEPTDDQCADFARGRRHACLAIEALRTERICSRQLETIVERMIERAFRRRGPAGRPCRQLSSSEQGFLKELCRVAVEIELSKGSAPGSTDGHLETLQPASLLCARQRTLLDTRSGLWRHLRFWPITSIRTRRPSCEALAPAYPPDNRQHDTQLLRDVESLGRAQETNIATML